MNRRDFLRTGIGLAAGAAIGEPHAARQAIKEASSTSLRPEHSSCGVLWLSTQGDPGTMLDAALRRFLFTRMATVVVLNGEVKGYSRLVAATHAQFPSLKVLRYSNAQRVPEGTRVACTYSLMYTGTRRIWRSFALTARPKSWARREAVSSGPTSRSPRLATISSRISRSK